MTGLTVFAVGIGVAVAWAASFVRSRSQRQRARAIRTSRLSSKDRRSNANNSGQLVLLLPGFALGLLGLGISSPTIVIASAMATVAIPLQLARMAKRRKREAAVGELPSLVDLLVVDLRSGASLSDGLARLSGATELDGARRLVAPMSKSLGAGMPLAQALGSLTTSTDPPLRLLGASLQVLASTGGPAIPALQYLRHTLMGSVHSQQQIRVQATQARASATVLSLAPLGFATLAAFADHKLAHFYMFEWSGTLCVVGSLLLTGIGWRWMMSLADRCDQSL